MATFSASKSAVDLAIDPLITCRLCLSECTKQDTYTLQDCGCIYCKAVCAFCKVIVKLKLNNTQTPFIIQEAIVTFSFIKHFTAMNMVSALPFLKKIRTPLLLKILS